VAQRLGHRSSTMADLSITDLTAPLWTDRNRRPDAPASEVLDSSSSACIRETEQRHWSQPLLA